MHASTTLWLERSFETSRFKSSELVGAPSSEPLDFLIASSINRILEAFTCHGADKGCGWSSSFPIIVLQPAEAVWKVQWHLLPIRLLDPAFASGFM